MTEWIAIGQLAIGVGQLMVGIAGVILVWQGLRQMLHAGDQREKREDARHREAMLSLGAIIRGMEQQSAALQTVIERTGSRV